MHRHLVAALWLLAGGAANAAPALLDDDALKKVLPGKTVHLDTPLGVAIPITYHSNGLMSGKAGMLSYILGADNDRGRWWVEHGKLCQKWFKWLDAKPNCMHVRLDGQQVFWQADDGKSGTATIAAGLANGADAPPRGLGGPLKETIERESRSVSVATHSSVTTDGGGRGSIAPAAAPVFATASFSPPVPVRVRPPQAHKPLPETLVETPAEPSHEARSCHAAETAAEEDAAPTLVVVTRQVLHSEIAPATDCFAVEPSLVAMARLSVGPR